MSMVEILLDFIRAEREGNWNLHLDGLVWFGLCCLMTFLSFDVMYDHIFYKQVQISRSDNSLVILHLQYSGFVWVYMG